MLLCPVHILSHFPGCCPIFCLVFHVTLYILSNVLSHIPFYFVLSNSLFHIPCHLLLSTNTFPFFIGLDSFQYIFCVQYFRSVGPGQYTVLSHVPLFYDGPVLYSCLTFPCVCCCPMLVSLSLPPPPLMSCHIILYITRPLVTG